MSPTAEPEVRRAAGWLPRHKDLESWLEGHEQRVGDRGSERPLHPAVRELQRLIDGDPLVGMLARRMIDEVPPAKLYTRRHLHSPEQMLRLIDAVMTMAPSSATRR